MSTPGSRTASPPRSAPKAVKKRAPKVPATHPPYVEMVRSAITALKERGGSSRQKIGTYIKANYDVGTEQTRINARLRTSLKSGVEKGVLVRSAKGTGANGSFRVGKALAKKKTAAKKGKRRAKSPKKKRSPKKKAAKKTASKRKPKKAAKKPKKKARKSPAKKAKRSPKKKAAARRKPAAKGKKAKR